MLFNGVLALGLRFLLVWENKKLDEKYGVVGRTDGDGKTQDGKGGVVESGAGIGDENDGPRFRYCL